MNENDELKMFCESVELALGGNLELEDIFIKCFKNDGGEEQCQLKK